LNFGDLLQALHEKGRDKDAEHYRKLVVDKFQGTLTESQINVLDINEILTIVKVAELVKQSYVRKPSPLESYVLELQSKGFTVSLGEKYR
jgi:hypothetical protein